MKKTTHGIITKYTIGEPIPGQSVDEKILMIVGATGADKTTLINVMVNYMCGVNWKDDFRFRLVRDELVHDQINAYTIYPEKGSLLDFTLTIIDTPEFQGLSNVEQHNQIAQQMQGLFDDINHLNGIGLVTSANLPQSGPVKTYIFNSILSLFGKNLAGSIFMMVTSADNQYPPVITAIKEANIPFKTYYKFENSILYASNANSEVDTCWEMNFVSLQQFFVVFSNTERVNLDLTINMLHKYKELKLEGDVNKLNELVNNSKSKLEELKEEEDKLHKCEEDITNFKEFTYTTKVVEKIKKYDPSNEVVTFCTICEYLCDESCIYDNDSEKYKCSSMDGGGEESAHCLECIGRCFWKDHVSRSYYYEEHETVKTIKDEELEKKYYAAQELKTVIEKVIKNIEQCLKENESVAIRIISEVQTKLLDLDEIKNLLPNSIIISEHLLQLIKAETNKQRTTFYKQRVAILKAKDGVDYLRGGAHDPKNLWYAKVTFQEEQ